MIRENAGGLIRRRRRQLVAASLLRGRSPDRFCLTKELLIFRIDGIRRASSERPSDMCRSPLAAVQRILSRNPPTTFQRFDASCRPARDIRAPGPGI
jgi:hypothetical protein